MGPLQGGGSWQQWRARADCRPRVQSLPDQNKGNWAITDSEDWGQGSL